MASKYEMISELYRRTGAGASGSPEAWQAFLSSACRNYKCRFDEQMLIYAQRPDATAVLEIKKWNEKFYRYVRRGSKGIAVFAAADNDKTRLKYYFDVSDTEPSYRGGVPVPIWQMSDRYEAAVIERLSDRFGSAGRKALDDALTDTAKTAVEDNLPDYLGQLADVLEGSYLEAFDEENIGEKYRRLVTNSVNFMLFKRCGLPTDGTFEREDFEDIVNFNTPETLASVGIATSDIAESVLREISQTIRDVQIAEKTEKKMPTHLHSPKKGSMIGVKDKPTFPKGVTTMSEITYTMQKDYLIPDLALPPQPEVPLGKFAHLRREYLENHRRVTFVNLLTSGKLTEHLYQIEQEAMSRFERLTKQLAQEQGVTEELKASDQIAWIGRMNNIRQQAEEMILSELIYS